MESGMWSPSLADGQSKCQNVAGDGHPKGKPDLDSELSIERAMLSGMNLPDRQPARDSGASASGGQASIDKAKASQQFSKEEVGAFLSDKDRLMRTYLSLRDRLDSNHDGFIDNNELSSAMTCEVMSRDGRLMTAALRDNYNLFADLGETYFPKHKGISRRDVEAYVAAKDYQAPHWLSPDSPGYCGEAERFAVWTAGVMGALAITARGNFGWAGRVGIMSAGISPFLMLHKRARENDDLSKRHQRITEMLESLR
jgi:hypothetical protein